MGLICVGVKKKRALNETEYLFDVDIHHHHHHHSLITYTQIDRIFCTTF